MTSSFLRLRVPPPILWTIATLIGVLASAAAPAAPILGGLKYFAVASIGATGMIFLLAGAGAMRRAGTTIDPTAPLSASQLVTDGPFLWSRNPMYVGFTAMLMAVLFALDNWWTAPVLAAYVVWLNEFQIKPEEAALRLRFGEAYSRYAGCVRRWL